MGELREFEYRFSGDVSDADALKDKISSVKGVSEFKIDMSAKSITYALDEWASEYDVVTAVMEIFNDFGAELLLSEENSDLLPDISDGENDDQKADSGETEESTEEKNDVANEKTSKYDFVEKTVVLGISAILFLVGLFLGKNQTAQMWVFMFSYTFAAYETLFDVITKAVEKRYFLDEILIILPTLIMLYLGKRVSASLIMLAFGITLFVKKIFIEKISSEISTLKTAENISDFDKKRLDFYEKIYSSTLTEEIFLKKNKLKIQLGFVLVGVIAAFIPPFFKISEYGSLLIGKWLYIGVSIMIFGTLSGFGEFVKALYFYGAEILFDKGVVPTDTQAIRKIANADEAVFDDSLKINTFGAVKELSEDTEIKTTLLSSEPLAEVNSLKKEYGFSKAVASCSEKYKIKYLSGGDKVYFGDADLNKTVLENVDCGVSMGEISEKALASATEKDLKLAPFTIKVAARTLKAVAVNALLFQLPKTLGVITGSILCASGIDLIPLFFAVDCAAQILSFIIARSNKRDTL